MTIRYVAWQPLFEEPAISPRTASTSTQVLDPEPQTVKTGLLDAQGRPIYRVEAMDPIGFKRWD